MIFTFNQQGVMIHEMINVYSAEPPPFYNIIQQVSLISCYSLSDWLMLTLWYITKIVKSKAVKTGTISPQICACALVTKFSRDLPTCTLSDGRRTCLQWMTLCAIYHRGTRHVNLYYSMLLNGFILVRAGVSFKSNFKTSNKIPPRYGFG